MPMACAGALAPSAGMPTGALPNMTRPLAPSPRAGLVGWGGAAGRNGSAGLQGQGRGSVTGGVVEEWRQVRQDDGRVSADRSLHLAGDLTLLTNPPHSLPKRHRVPSPPRRSNAPSIRSHPILSPTRFNQREGPDPENPPPPAATLPRKLHPPRRHGLLPGYGKTRTPPTDSHPHLLSTKTSRTSPPTLCSDPPTKTSKPVFWGFLRNKGSGKI